ncbi:hypothetical protein M3Y97_00112100 [Aphelenchoides bicaudatus]|nr:hypothetical protein M3Y97_00112100 [Aphelenchoides bicaudatus]
MMRRLRLLQTLLFFAFWLPEVESRISCYTCANDFIVWNWRHYFLKRNYHVASSDNSCADRTAFPDKITKCSTSCFLFYVNGTDKETGQVINLGVGRGCSGQFLTDEQYSSRSLGVQSRPSEAAHYLPHSYDKYDIHEHWCFCASDYCNVESCFVEWRYSSSYGYSPLTPQRKHQNSYNYDRRRSDNEYYSDYVNSYWAFYNGAHSQTKTGLSITVLLFSFSMFFRLLI